MEAKIIEREAMTLLGTTARINPMGADYMALWAEFGKRATQVSALAVGQDAYAAYFGSDEPGKADFVAGMAVPDDASAPEGLVRRVVPAGTYAEFQCMMATISRTWGAIYETWLPQSDWAEDETRPSLECYGADMSHSATGKVIIQVPVVKKD